MMVSLLHELGRGLPNPLRCEGLLWDMTALSLQFGKITLHSTNCRERRVGSGLPAQPPLSRRGVAALNLGNKSVDRRGYGV